MGIPSKRNNPLTFHTETLEFAVLMSGEISLDSTIVNPGMRLYRDLSQHRILYS